MGIDLLPVVLKTCGWCRWTPNVKIEHCGKFGAWRTCGCLPIRAKVGWEVYVLEEEGGQSGGGVTKVGALDAGWNIESVCQVW